METISINLINVQKLFNHCPKLVALNIDCGNIKNREFKKMGTNV